MFRNVSFLYTNLHLEFCFGSFSVPFTHFDFSWRKREHTSHSNNTAVYSHCGDILSSRFFHTNGCDKFGSRKGFASFVYLQIYKQTTKQESKSAVNDSGSCGYYEIDPKSCSRFLSFFSSRRRCRSCSRANAYANDTNFYRQNTLKLWINSTAAQTWKVSFLLAESFLFLLFLLFFDFFSFFFFLCFFWSCELFITKLIHAHWTLQATRNEEKGKASRASSKVCGKEMFLKRKITPWVLSVSFP